MAEQFNIKTHVLVPVHKKISNEEKEELLKKYNLSFKQLPKILSNDSALEGLEVVSGDVVQIIRKSIDLGEVPYYRVVVNGKRI